MLKIHVQIYICMHKQLCSVTMIEQIPVGETVPGISD